MSNVIPIRGKKSKGKTPRDRMLADLVRSGLNEKDAKKLGCKLVSGAKAQRLLKLSKINLPDGYTIPYHDANGNLVEGALRWRALAEYTQRDRKTGKQVSGPKYRQPGGTEPWIYQSPLGIDWAEVEGPVVITEGEKKSACACKAGIPTVGIGGVWSWRRPKSDDELLPDFVDALCESAYVEVCFDSDLHNNSNVKLALVRLCAALEKSDCNVQVVYLPPGENDEKVGLDDFLVAAGTKSNGKFSRKRARRAFENLPRHDPPEIEPVTMQCVDDIATEPLLPIWPGIIYRKKVTLLPGDPGVGKSLLSCDIAARVTQGFDWPCGESAIIDPSNVAMLSGEDDPSDTIKPRLMAHGADLSKVFIIKDQIQTKNGEIRALSLDKHIKYIHKKVLSVRAKLLVIDPISAFEGDRDANKNSVVRALISKLGQYATEGDYAVLLISHWNKPTDKLNVNAIHRVLGSIGLVAACRASHAFVRDPEDREHRLLLPIKVNLGPDKDGGFGCRIETDNEQNLCPPPPVLKWDSERITDRTIDEIMEQASPREQTRKLKEQAITEWLETFMKRGQKMDSTDFNDKVQEHNFSSILVTKLMTRLGYRKEKQGFDGGWCVIRDKKLPKRGKNTKNTGNAR